MKNEYTLYIDESGDFESPRGHWVIGGLLIGANVEKAEHLLNARFANIPKTVGESSIRNFHLTDFRAKYGHEEALAKADTALGTLDRLSIDYKFVAVINFTKTKVGYRERTYRLMLADLLALIETLLDTDESIASLDVVVATRTIDGVQQTSVSDIDQDIVRSLPYSMEVGLATRGLVELLDNHLNVKMDGATRTWGLVCADFISNINYHRERPRERRFLDSLEARGRFSSFESFGGYEMRRARVSARNGDFAQALHQWIVISIGKKAKTEAPEAIKRLLHTVFSTSGSSGARVVFEALLERIWRRRFGSPGYTAVLAELSSLECEFESFLSGSSFADSSHLLFRLRNLLLLVSNHLGLAENSSRLVALQAATATFLASNPEHFNKVLDFKALEVESFVNELDFESAQEGALEHRKVVDNYCAVWQLLAGEQESQAFKKSRLSVKAEMSFVRLRILGYGLEDIVCDVEIEEVLNSLSSVVVDGSDRSRLQNYWIMYFLKRGKWSEAVEVHLSSVNEGGECKLGAFDVFWTLRAINDGLLNGVSFDDGGSVRCIDKLIRSISWDAIDHPADLIAREAALYHHLRGDLSLAKKMLKTSRRLIAKSDSPISLFLIAILQIHEDYISGRESVTSEVFQMLDNNVWVGKVLRCRPEMALLLKLRYFSPY